MKIRDAHGKYTLSFKKDIVRRVDLGKITKAEAGRKYGILGHSTILRWQRKFSEMSTAKTTLATKSSKKSSKS